jgi:hypothetical protein
MTRLWIALVVVLLGTTSCSRTNDIIYDSNYAVAMAHSRAQNKLRQVKAEWDQAIDAAARDSKQKFIYIKCSSVVPSGGNCGLISPRYKSQSFQERFQREHCSDGSPVSGCRERYQIAFEAALRVRYGSSAVNEGLNGESLLEMELSVLKVHNDQVLQEYKIVSEGINSKYKGRMENLLAQFRTEISALEAERNAELEAERESSERVGRIFLALGSGLQAAGRGLASDEPTTTPGPVECMSDFGCSYGQKCLKNYGSMRGVCARVVNEYGSPTFSTPSSDSFSPGKGTCMSTGCPLGFRCLSGNCIK